MTNDSLLDVNLLVACAWSSHERHREANRWLDALPRFATCAISEMGFLRISMSPAFGASYSEARIALGDLLKVPTHHFLKDATTATRLPKALASRHDITDAHLVTLARLHGFRLATLDGELCRKEWARDVAFHPFAKT